MISRPVRVARFINRTEAEGPGTRSALWVQGCTIRCPGCFNPHLWGTHGGRMMAPERIAADIPLDVEGLTLLGGEPFEQAEPLAELARLVQGRGQTVMTFTGYELDELRCAASPAVADLLNHTDLLVDGRFEVDRLDTARPWVGSTNQRFHALTARYADLADRLAALPDRLEIRIALDGRVDVNGWADTASLEILFDGLRRPPSSAPPSPAGIIADQPERRPPHPTTATS